jgi:cell division protein FtsB
MYVSQTREIKHQRFAMFHSGNAFPIQALKDLLCLSSFECTRDSHGNNYTIFNTTEQKRTNQILLIINEFNRFCPGKSIRVGDELGLEPSIVTFGIHNNYRKHHIYLKIKSAKEAKKSGSDVIYETWNLAIQKKLDRDEEISRQEEDLIVQEAVMEEDPSAFNISFDHASVGARLVRNEAVALQLQEGIQTEGISSVGSNESYLIIMASAMDKLTRENAKLTEEKAKLTRENAKLTEEKARLTEEKAKLTGELRAELSQGDF